MTSLAQQELNVLLAGSERVFIRVYPELAIRGKKLITALAAAGLPFGAFMGLRTFTEQNALYEQGRSLPGKVITNARGGSSWHNFGLALDMVEDGDLEQAGIQWSWKKNADYLLIGDIAKSVGLEWGGFWKSFKDYPHVQLTGSLSLPEANRIYQVNGLDGVYYEVSKRLQWKTVA